MATVSAAQSKLALESNIPQLIALKYRMGKECASRFSEEKEVFYTLKDGRVAYLPLAVSNAIDNLKLGLAETFYICKYWNGDRKQRPRINVWYTPEGERQRAIEESGLRERATRAAAEPSYLEHQLAASIADAEHRRRPPQSTESEPSPEGTGTSGPVAVPAQRQQPEANAETPAPVPANLQPWGQRLLAQTQQLITVYAAACEDAERQGVPKAVVRSVMLSAFIGLQRNSGALGGQ